MLLFSVLLVVPALGFSSALVCSRHLSASELQGDTKRQEKSRGFSATPFSATASATVLGPMVPSPWFGGKPGKDPASLSMDFPLLGTCWLNWEELRPLNNNYSVD